jgi:cbb3-type cytochrome oxidase maturation protein
MSVLYIVLPLALLVVGAAVAAFVWATSRGQFDDLDTPGLRMLHDDDPVAAPASPPKKEAI